MTDSRYDEIQRGDMANQLLNSHVMKEALDTIEQEILSAWEATNFKDTDARERAWYFYLASKKFRNTLINYIQTGKMAVMQLEEQKRFKLFNRGK